MPPTYHKAGRTWITPVNITIDVADGQTDPAGRKAYSSFTFPGLVIEVSSARFHILHSKIRAKREKELIIASFVPVITQLSLHKAIGTTKRKDPSFREIPGWPLLGQLPGSILDISRPWEADTIIGLKLRPGFSITLPGARVVEVSKPEWIEHIQKTNFENYVKGEMFQSLMADLFGKSILVTDGADWKRSRLVTSRVFHISVFKTVVEPRINPTMIEVLDVLQVSSDEGRAIDFSNLFNRFTLDLFVEMTYGKKLGLLGEESRIRNGDPAGSSYSEVFSDAFDFSQKYMDSRFHMSKSAPEEDYISDEDESQEDFLGLIMGYHLQRGHALTRDELRDDSLSFVLAGRDATAQSLSWCFFHLLMNKDIVSRIRQEAADILGAESDNQASVTPENYRQFICTYASLLEAIRLHPGVPKNVKFAMADDKIPGGPTIEAGDCVTWSDWQLARDPEVWGPDCGQFVPDRWIDETGNIRHFGNFKFHSFNGGPRLCVGMNMAIYIAVKSIVDILINFDLQFAKGCTDHP
ncbi:hypothetical protein KEM48_010640 [Puccinia striiformis f. sp. tritici PST-130]|nr:hypothetical protein KEM48_010640 [Puccinia striiformis f. sp. tritici PST-130]